MYSTFASRRVVNQDMATDFDPRLHTFGSQPFQSVVHEAIEFLNQTPIQILPPALQFVGAGVYALYYVGDFDLYGKIAKANQSHYTQPIYVGKAVPPGWRTARASESETPDLYRRLREHGRGIQQASSLKMDEFRCRFEILSGSESDLIATIEAALIRQYTPLWNTVIDGFGNHDPGSGRYDQAPSEWDILHPGRPWAERLRGEAPVLYDLIDKIQRFLEQLPLP